MIYGTTDCKELYDDLVSKYRVELQAMESKANERKREIIEDLAEKAHSVVNEDEVAAKVSEDLKGYVSRSYIYEIINTKYKKKQKRYQELESSGVELTNVQEQNEIKKPKYVEEMITNNGSYAGYKHQESNPEPEVEIITNREIPDPDPRYFIKREEVEQSWVTKDRYEAQKKDYDSLAEKFNGLQSELDYVKDELQKLTTEGIAPIPLATAPATPTPEPIPTTTRNPNKGYWVKFSMSNYELTRPLISLVGRMKGLADRPKEFWLEIIGDDVIEIAEARPQQQG